MKRTEILCGLIVAVACTAGCGSRSEIEDVGSVELAQSVHLKGGRNAEPTFVDTGLSLRASGALAGLGNEDVVITLDAEALAFAECINPGTGEHRPPGQNPAPVDVSGGVSIPAEEIKNGNLNFSVFTVAPTSPVPGAPGCPNPRWEQRITDLAFTSAIITVEQPEGTVVLTLSCTFSSPTTDGAVSGNNVTCEEI